MKDNLSEPKAASLILHIHAGEDTDAEELDCLTRQLLAEIQELGVESVELVKTSQYHRAQSQWKR